MSLLVIFINKNDAYLCFLYVNMLDFMLKYTYKRDYRVKNKYLPEKM